jgi:hypothetical protein
VNHPICMDFSIRCDFGALHRLQHSMLPRCIASTSESDETVVYCVDFTIRCYRGVLHRLQYSIWPKILANSFHDGFTKHTHGG